MMERKNKALIIDDEPQIRKFLRVTMEAEGYAIEETDTGGQGVRLAAAIKPDIVIVDLGLPDIDGTEVISRVREWSQVPIMVLSVRSDDRDIAQALDLGADDYLVKPFGIEVLLARLRANLRKAARQEGGEPELESGPLRMDLVRHETFLHGEKLALSPKEYNLLRFFISHSGRMLTHRQILKEVWGEAHGEDIQYLRVYIGQLRQKIERNPSEPELIISEPGIGYRLEDVQNAKAEA